MRFVEVATFSDLPETEVAASALRVSGIPVILQRDFLPRIRFDLLQAVGGIGLCVPEDDAGAARQFLELVRRQPSTATPLAPIEDIAWRSITMVLGFLTGIPGRLRPRRPERLGDGA